MLKGTHEYQKEINIKMSGDNNTIGVVATNMEDDMVDRVTRVVRQAVANPGITWPSRYQLT